MSHNHVPNMNPAGSGRKRLSIPAVVLLLSVLMPVQAFADNTQALLRSLIVPGSGQAHKGHYTKAAVFAGATILTGAGVFLTRIQYNQANDRYQNAKRTYLGYPDQLSGGTVISVTDINQTYSDMTTAWDDADSRYKWQRAFMVMLGVTYVVNIVDVLMSDPAPADPEIPRVEESSHYYFQTDLEGVRVGAKFGF